MADAIEPERIERQASPIDRRDAESTANDVLGGLGAGFPERPREADASREIGAVGGGESGLVTQTRTQSECGRTSNRLAKKPKSNCLSAASGLPPEMENWLGPPPAARICAGVDPLPMPSNVSR